MQGSIYFTVKYRETGKDQGQMDVILSQELRVRFPKGNS